MSTIPSVSDVQSTDAACGVPSSCLPKALLSELIDASNALAFPHLRARKGEDGTHETLCQVCLRGAGGQGEIPHTSTCVVGRAIRAAWAVQAAIVRQEAWEARPVAEQIPAAEREIAARRLEEVTRRPARCGVQSVSAENALCTLPAGHPLPHRDDFLGFAFLGECVHASTECDGKNPLLEEVRPVEESEESWQASAALLKPRRVVCGAHWGFHLNPTQVLTCDKEPGHDADPRSDHFNRARGFSWPTAAAIAEEMAAR